MEKAKPWEWRGFSNPARSDGLILHHWAAKKGPNASSHNTVDGTCDAMQVDSEQPEELDYHFARFNIKPRLAKYTDAEYAAVGKAEGWSREETDYLWDLCEEYDLRFYIVADRYEYLPSPPPSSTPLAKEESTVEDGSVSGLGEDEEMKLPPTPSSTTPPAPTERSLEDIKHRYYTLTRSLLALRTSPSQMLPDELTYYNLLAFDKEKETARKKMALTLFHRTPEEVREEEFLLAEMKRILANQERLLEERQDLFNRLDAPQSTQSIAAYSGSQGLHNLSVFLQSNSDKSKKRKSVVLGPGGVPIPNIDTSNISSADGGKPGQTPTTAAGPTPTSNRPDVASSTAPTPTTHRKSSSISAATPTSASSSTPHPRPQLSADLQRHLGVAYHEKIASGVYLRSSKVCVIKGSNQPKVQAALAELGIPPKLTMATVKTCQKMEGLNQAVSALLDARKLLEKLEQEVRVEKGRLENLG